MAISKLALWSNAQLIQEIKNIFPENVLLVSCKKQNRIKKIRLINDLTNKEYYTHTNIIPLI